MRRWREILRDRTPRLVNGAVLEASINADITVVAFKLSATATTFTWANFEIILRFCLEHSHRNFLLSFALITFPEGYIRRLREQQIASR